MLSVKHEGECLGRNRQLQEYEIQSLKLTDKHNEKGGCGYKKSCEIKLYVIISMSKTEQEALSQENAKIISKIMALISFSEARGEAGYLTTYNRYLQGKGKLDRLLI